MHSNDWGRRHGGVILCKALDSNQITRRGAAPGHTCPGSIFADLAYDSKVDGAHFRSRGTTAPIPLKRLDRGPNGTHNDTLPAH